VEVDAIQRGIVNHLSVQWRCLCRLVQVCPSPTSWHLSLTSRFVSH